MLNKFIGIIFFFVMMALNGDCQLRKDVHYSFEETKDEIYASVNNGKYLKNFLNMLDDQFDLEEFNRLNPLYDYGGKIGFNAVSDMIKVVVVNDLKFDIYKPEDGRHTPPLIIFVHGGGFLFGTRKDDTILRLCKEFAQRGYAAATIEYRLGAWSTFNMIDAGYIGTQDGIAAIQYFRANSKELNIDPNRIVIAGISAGGFIALNAGHFEAGDAILDQTNRLKSSYGLIDGLSQAYSSWPYDVSGVINIVGGSAIPKVLKSKTPTLHVFCKQDSVVPAYQGRPMSSSKYSFLDSFFTFPDVFGPEYFKRNLNLTNHTYYDVSKITSNPCTHSFFTTGKGAITDEGRAALDRINSWLFELFTPKIKPVIGNRPIQVNSWKTLSLPNDVVSFSVNPNSDIKIDSLNNNTFRIMSIDEGRVTLKGSMTNDLGLSSDFEMKFDTSTERSFLDDDSKTNSNFWLIIIIFLTFVISLTLILKFR